MDSVLVLAVPAESTHGSLFQHGSPCVDLGREGLRIMKYQISKVVVNYARNAAGLNEKDREFETQAAAAAFLWKLKPRTALEIPVDVCATIHWEDGTWCGEMWKMTSDPNSIHNPRWAIWNKMAFFAGIYLPTGMTEEA